jgi:hypothetical protein
LGVNEMNQHPELDQLATELFRVFSRMEYALKAAGFNLGDGDAKADWRGFAQSLGALFDHPPDEGLREAVEAILHAPPKKQIIRNGQIEWTEAAPDTDLSSDRVLIYVRRVRNNLFHGGKFNGHWFEPERSESLLRSSLKILHSCLDANDNVHRAYDG